MLRTWQVSPKSVMLDVTFWLCSVWYYMVLHAWVGHNNQMPQCQQVLQREEDPIEKERHSNKHKKYCGSGSGDSMIHSALSSFFNAWLTVWPYAFSLQQVDISKIQLITICCCCNYMYMDKNIFRRYLFCQKDTCNSAEQLSSMHGH